MATDFRNSLVWQTDRATVTYSFLANIAIMLGYSNKQRDFLVRIYNELFQTKMLEKESLAYKMLESLGRLPNTYHIGEIFKFNQMQKDQLKKWYIESLSLEPMMKIELYAILELKNINKFVLNL